MRIFWKIKRFTIFPLCFKTIYQKFTFNFFQNTKTNKDLKNYAIVKFVFFRSLELTVIARKISMIVFLILWQSHFPLPMRKFILESRTLIFSCNFLQVAEASKKVWTSGCIEIVRSWAERNLYTIAGIALGVALSQLLVIYLAKTLEGQIDLQKSRWASWNIGIICKYEALPF